MRREGPGQRSDYSTPVAERPVLVLQRPDGTSVEYELVRDQPLTLGREAGNDVILKSTFVSKQHAVVRYEGGQFLIEDLKSANGTRVNGAPISVSLLAPEDKIEVGDQNLTFLDRAVLKAGKKGDSTGRSGGAAAAAAAPNPAAKMLKLGGVALVFGLVLFLGMRFLLLSNAPRTYDDTPADGPAAAWPAAGGTPAPLATDSPLMQQVLAQAKTAGVSPADALYDEALS